MTEEQYFDSRLEQLGLSPADIETVVLSHLHLDHAGNARMFESTGARFVVHRAELEHATAFEGPYDLGYFKVDASYTEAAAVEREFGRLKHEWALSPLRGSGRAPCRPDRPRQADVCA